LAFGLHAAVAVFFAPVLFYGDDEVLLLWGWIAPFIALPVAYATGWLVRALIGSYLSAGNEKATWVRVAKSTSFAGLLVAVITYFMATVGDRDVRWVEEAVLHDGSIAMVSRRVVGNSFGRSKVRPSDWLPTVYEVSVTSTTQSRTHVPSWQSPLRPVLLEKGGTVGSWVLLAEPKDCGEWYFLGKPAPPYVAYEVRKSGWSQVTFPPELLGRSANLLVAPRFTGEGPVVGAAEVVDRNTASVPKDAWPIIRESSKC
jgi:hypothetical protein